MAMRSLLGVVVRRTPVYRGGGRNTGGSQWGMLNAGPPSPATTVPVRTSYYDRIAYGGGMMDPVGVDFSSSVPCCHFHLCNGSMGLQPSSCLPMASSSGYCSPGSSLNRGAVCGISRGSGLGRGLVLPAAPQLAACSPDGRYRPHPHPHHQLWARERWFSTSLDVGAASHGSLVAEEKTYARDVLEYNEVLFKLSRSKRAYLMRDVYEDMLMDGIRPNRDTFHLLIPACMKAHRLQDVMYFFSEMKSSGLIPDLVLFNCIISTCGRCFQVRRAFEVAEEMQALGIQPKLRTFVALLNACGTSGRVEEAYDVVRQMAGHGLTLNKYCYSALITAHKNRRPVTQDTFVKIFELLDEARTQNRANLEDDLAESGVGEDYDEMSEEMTWMQDVPAKRGLITHRAAVYNAALRAFVDLRNHEAAMKVVDRIKEDGLKPDAYVFTHLIRSYLMQGDMDKAVVTFDKYMATGGHPSLDIFIIMIEGAIRRYKPESMELAKRLLKMMEEHGYFLNPKFGGQLLSLAAREHGGDFSTANMIWDMLDRQNRKPHFKAAFAYLQGLQNRGTNANDQRLLAVKSLVSPDLMRLQRQVVVNVGRAGSMGVEVGGGPQRPEMRSMAGASAAAAAAEYSSLAGRSERFESAANVNSDDECTPDESDDDRANTTKILVSARLLPSLTERSGGNGNMMILVRDRSLDILSMLLRKGGRLKEKS
ncbi:hypothetical protein CBR_g20410 [Chara braunii]|uniref:PROP1-like PPR domain-containing protein n=1 Tax=Chara braunii TaxID=69332 RepID=A0A388JU90_CHABU|nr:hypothetical protein CBR_g20410 [Chara braunii]|eukprot:GBG61379.1 hypothetical protein CBR_g20410 [Chara braunii]